MKRDLTIIFLTVNRVPEKWRLFHRQKLLEAIKGYYLITVSAKPLPDMPGVNIIQEEPFNASNIYKQMLRAAKLATTPFIAIVEDDSLYHEEHFHSFRPKDDEFGYNMSRWALFTWGVPTYWWRNRLSNLTLLAPRKLLIQCLEERFAKFPDGTPEGRTGEVGKSRIEKMLGLPEYKYVQFWTTVPIINLNHVNAMDPREKNMKKRMAPLRAFDVPYWNKAEDIVKHFV
jgi:hypothetical protein